VRSQKKAKEKKKDKPQEICGEERRGAISSTRLRYGIVRGPLIKMGSWGGGEGKKVKEEKKKGVGRRKKEKTRHFQRRFSCKSSGSSPRE